MLAPSKNPRPKATRKPTAAAAADPSGLIVEIPLEQLQRHRDNRTIEPDSVAELADSLREHGQKEPIRVRPIPDPIGHYEILSGERRYVAAGLAGIDSLKCIIEDHDDAAALLELAVANAARQNLDPIQRAELMQKLIASGIDRAAAGRVFGLGSESGIKNALRLLSLPKYFRDLLTSKQINVQQARLLVPYPDQFLNALADHLRSKKTMAWTKREFLQDADGTEGVLKRFAREHTRPMDNAKYYHGYQLGDHPALFKADEKQTAALTVTEIPGDKAGEVKTVALNVKLWHKLQDPLAKAAAKKADERRLAKFKPKGKAANAEPTAAELKRKTADQDDQLNRFTRDWIRTALRCVMSSRYEWPEGCVEYLLPSLMAEATGQRSYGSPDLATLHEWAVSECEPHDGGRLDSLAAVNQRMGLIALDFPTALWRVTLWPVATTNHPHADLAPGSIPERLPTLSHSFTDELAAAVGVSMETVWTAATVDGFPRELVRQWLTRHLVWQLVALAKELKLSIDPGRRGDMVDAILSQHTAGRPLRIPARVTKMAVSTGRRKR